MECHRRAWLVHPVTGSTVSLEDDGGSWVCPELNIGWPAIREVTDNRPDQDGIDDRTSLFGARVVSAKVVAGQAGRKTIDDIARLFGPFLIPSIRPELHWVLDTPDDNYAERMLTLRANDFSSPIAGALTRDITMAWTCPDPVIRDAAWREATARPQWGQVGVTFDITFDLTFPAGQVTMVADLTSPGDVIVEPTVRIFGGVTRPGFRIVSFPPGQAQVENTFQFLPTYRIDPGHFVDVDCRTHTAIQDDGTHVEAAIDWAVTTWPYGLGNNVETRMWFLGESVDAVTQAVARWRDGFLSP